MVSGDLDAAVGAYRGALEKAPADWPRRPDVLVSLMTALVKLKNVGGEAHDMVGGSFFDAIVARMTNSRTGRVVTPYLRSIYVSPRQEIEIWFVAVRPGSYEFFCSLPGHRDAGMEGEVIIE